MMRLFFNELSTSPVADSKHAAIDRMAIFAKTVSIARQKGFRNIQCDYPVNTIQLADKYSMYDWLNDPIVSRECRDFMYGVIVPPYIEEDDIEFERFVDAVISYENKEFNIPKTKCIGIAASYLYDLPTISLLSIPLWKQHRLSVIVEKEGSISVENIYNISSYESFDIPDLKDYIDNISRIVLVETTINPEDKVIHLADHHGKAELRKLCERLKYNPFVEFK